MLPLGLSMAVTIRVAHGLGRGDTRQCRNLLIGAQATTFLIMGASAAIAYILAGDRIEPKQATYVSMLATKPLRTTLHLMQPLTAEAIIQHYRLEPLDQEGGYFRQVWRSEPRVPNETLGAPYPPGESHPMGTLIYFLLTTDSFSAMHRLPSPEHWFYHLGDPAEMLLLHPDGSGEQRILGPDLFGEQAIQLTTPRNSWQGTRLLTTPGNCGFCLVSCVMVPGFEWNDFETCEVNTLVAQYPKYAEAIRLRNRDTPVSGEC